MEHWSKLNHFLVTQVICDIRILLLQLVSHWTCTCTMRRFAVQNESYLIHIFTGTIVGIFYQFCVLTFIYRTYIYISTHVGTFCFRFRSELYGNNSKNKAVSKQPRPKGDNTYHHHSSALTLWIIYELILEESKSNH